MIKILTLITIILFLILIIVQFIITIKDNKQMNIMFKRLNDEYKDKEVK